MEYFGGALVGLLGTVVMLEILSRSTNDFGVYYRCCNCHVNYDDYCVIRLKKGTDVSVGLAFNCTKCGVLLRLEKPNYQQSSGPKSWRLYDTSILR